MLKNKIMENVSYYVFIEKGYKFFAPQYVAIDTTVRCIFPVPMSNAIGVLDGYRNGIICVKFNNHGRNIEYETIARDFSEMVYNKGFYYRFSPHFHENTIIYSKTRIAVIVNVETGKVFHAESDLSTDDFMLGIRFLDPHNNLFVIVKSTYKDGNKREDYLHIVKLEGQVLIDTNWVIKLGKARRISSDFPLYHTWFVRDRKLFVYDCNKMLCTDGKQQLVHPFSEIFNCNFSRFGDIKDFILHPELPFGIMIEERADIGIIHRLVVIRWDTQKPKKQVVVYENMFLQLTPFFGSMKKENVEEEGEEDEKKYKEDITLALAYQSFSPCGKWYVVGCIAPDEPKSPHFIAIPVDHEHPNLLDRSDIVVLGQVKGMTSLAWTSNPTSFVVSDGELLHKWDLDELPNACVFVMPGEDGGKKKSIFRRIGGLFGGRK